MIFFCLLSFTHVDERFTHIFFILVFCSLWNFLHAMMIFSTALLSPTDFPQYLSLVISQNTTIIVTGLFGDVQAASIHCWASPGNVIMVRSKNCSTTPLNPNERFYSKTCSELNIQCIIGSSDFPY